MRIKPNHRHLPWNTKVPDCITLSATLGTAGARVPNAGGQASGLCKGVLAHGIIVQKAQPPQCFDDNATRSCASNLALVV